jgi:signal peptidase I
MDSENKELRTEKTAPPKSPDQKIEKKENFLWEIIKFAAVALIIIVPMRAYVAEPFIVSGLSMFPTFNNGQYLIVDELTYHFREPARGDVIVFRYPLNPSTFFIKRIIALPSETLSVTDGVATIINSTHPNGMVLEEPYIAGDHRSYDTFKITLGPTEYFVMGDNRSQSSDSRVWGALDRKFITGRPFVRLLPPTAISIFPGEDALGAK